MTSPRPAKKSKPTAAPGTEATTAAEECAECFGTGYLVVRGESVPCPCGVAKRRDIERRLRASGIPRVFLRKGFAGFEPHVAALGAIVDAAQAYARGFALPVDSGASYPGLMFRGRPGCGKTHLSVAVLRTVIERGFAGHYRGFNDLLARLRDSYNDHSPEREAALLEPLAEAQLLVLDDLGAESPTDWMRDRLYLIVNRRYEAGLPMIVTTNCTEAELEARIGPRTASRLYEMCCREMPVFQFPEVDYRRAKMH